MTNRDEVTPARDLETALRVARQAAGISYSTSGLRSHAGRVYDGKNDADPAVQAALLAYTHGTDLLNPAEPVEPPEVTAAREWIADLKERDMLGGRYEPAAASESFLAGVKWARKQEGK